MDEPAPKYDRIRQRGAHDLAYVLGEGASVGRSRVMQGAISVAPLVLLNAAFVLVVYLAVIARATTINWGAFAIVGPVLAALPVIIALILVSLRDHEQPVTVAVFVTAVTVAVAIAVLSAARIFISYSGAFASEAATVLVMIVVMLRLKQAQSERVALLDFPGAALALDKLGGNIPVIRGADDDLSRYDRFIIDTGSHYSDQWSHFMLRAHMRGVLVTPWVQFLERRRGRVDIESFDFSDVVVSSGQIMYSRFKRFIDIAGVLLTLPISIPLGLAVFLYVKAMSPTGPALFMQRRRGYGGHDFTIYKFRTMAVDAGHEAVGLRGDRRVLPGMKLVRHLRLDELPQLYNILLGEMSIVGPRPEAVPLAALYEQGIPRYVDRLMVRPGLTGWAQVNAAASSNLDQAREKLAYDLYYIKRLSLDLDLLILGKTLQILALGMNKPVGEPKA